MTKRAPGKSFREGISLFKIMKMFPDDEAAKSWFIETRWPDGPHCPYCGSINIQSGSKHKTMPYLCREKECAKRFSARTDTAMNHQDLVPGLGHCDLSYHHKPQGHFFNEVAP